jgi:hypothetical protein
LGRESPYSDALTWFENRALVTIGCGTTCGCLGDERSLREYLVADETARRLRDAGHAVVSLLVDDSLDPLDYRQLRIALNKDESLINKWAGWCGKPIAYVPDPWDCHSSYAAHIEESLLDRLHGLDCYPNLISTHTLYEGGLYAPYVQYVLRNYDRIMEFLNEHFPGYQPETLFRVLCDECGCIDQTKIERIDANNITFYCQHCEKSHTVSLDEVKGKLNWKLDCAVRWVILNIDTEPFNKAYLEPQTGSFVVAQEISKTFFGGHDILPLHYGLVHVDKSVSYKLLSTLPGDVLRTVFVERATADLTITTDYVLNIASRCQVDFGLSYLDCIRQLVPMWLLRPQALTDRQRELVAQGIRFAEDFLGQEIALQLPTRERVEDTPLNILIAMHGFLLDIIRLREKCGPSWDAFFEPTIQLINSLGDHKRLVISHLRAMLGQKQGVPASKFLFLVPLNYLCALEYMLELRLYPFRSDSAFTGRLAA